MDTSASSSEAWSDEDLRGVLEHQLRVPLHLEADRLTRYATCSEDKALDEIHRGPYGTFLDVLTRGAPRDQALVMVKGYAKASLNEGGVLPTEVARVLYVATLLRSLNQDQAAEGFTRLDEASIRSEAQRCLTQPWLPESARELLRRGLRD
jgi:hypothetical protein